MRERVHPGNRGTWTLEREMVYAAPTDSAKRPVR